MCREELEARLGRLEEQLAHALRENERLQRENERLRGRVHELEGLLEAARRAGKRQAAPHSKGDPLPDPARPGRRSGKAHGKAARREPPGEEQIDRTLQVPLPAACPDCGGPIEPTGVSEQIQIELPPATPVTTRYVMERGRCPRCGTAQRARHPDQTSDATGACGVMLGPRAVAAGAMLHHELGLSFEKVARVGADLFGIAASRAAWCRAAARVGEQAAPTYEALTAELQESASVSMDETGWVICGRKAWLWTGASPRTTVYHVALGRGFDQATKILGAGYPGVIVRDGWAPYRRYDKARHQTCVAHLLRRANEMAGDAPTPYAQRLPREVTRILKAALELRNLRDRDALTASGLAARRQALEAEMDRLLAVSPRIDANRRLVQHLRKERTALFTFLDQPDIDATNFRAEQAIRPAVVIRKVWGGHRTPAGARVGERLMSLARTCRQRGLDPIAQMVTLQRARAPLVLPLAAPAQ